MEGWLSGRKRRIANPLYELLRTEGSNPSLSENRVNSIYNSKLPRKLIS
jgi:hypothetical protein